MIIFLNTFSAKPCFFKLFCRLFLVENSKPLLETSESVTVGMINLQHKFHCATIPKLHIVAGWAELNISWLAAVHWSGSRMRRQTTTISMNGPSKVCALVKTKCKCKFGIFSSSIIQLMNTIQPVISPILIKLHSVCVCVCVLHNFGWCSSLP